MQTSNLYPILRTAKIFLALNTLAVFFFDFVRIGEANVTLQGFDLIIWHAALPYAEIANAPNFWATTLLFSCLLQFLVTAFWPNRAAIWCISAMGMLALVMLQLDFIALWQSQGVSIRFGYWLAFGIFFMIALCHAVDGNLKQRPTDRKEHIHINIFTEPNNH